MPGTGGAVPSQPPASPTPIRGADATLAAAHREATIAPGARGYDSRPWRSRALPTANPQTFAHVVVTFRPQRIYTGITESREISWLGQAWLSATQFSPPCIQSNLRRPPDHQTRWLLDSFSHCSFFPKHHDPTTARH